MSRRTFIKQSALITGGFFVNNQLFAALANSDNKIMNIGIIGCGDRGTGIMKVMKELPDLYKVIAICDTLDFRLTNATKIEPTKVYTNYLKLLEDKSIDAVVIATPLNLHFEIAKAALEANKHVFLEKAMTHTIAQAIELTNIMKKYPKQTLQVGHQFRSSPLYYKVKEMIKSGYLGKVTQIDARWDRNWNWRRPVPNHYTDRQINWRMYKEYSGGLAAELLSHQIDFVNWAFDTQPDQIYATGGVDYYKDGRETFDNIQATLRYSKEGMMGNFGATCANERDGYLFKIKGTKGTISLLMNEGIYYPEKTTKKELETVDGVTGATKITWNTDGGFALLPEPTKDGTWYALKDFYTCVTENKIPDSNIFTGAKTAIAVGMINESAYTNTIQNWLPEYNLTDLKEKG